VTDTLDASVDGSGGETELNDNGYAIFSGNVSVKLRDPSVREAVHAYLQNRGFTLGRTFSSGRWEVWRFLAIEYSVKEAVELLTSEMEPEFLEVVSPCPVIYLDRQCFLPADATGNGVVNILDLIFVRNQLGNDPLSGGDAMRAEVNLDGKINILDLVFVRNSLGQSCDQ
jgi:hypothetical protein